MCAEEETGSSSVGPCSRPSAIGSRSDSRGRATSARVGRPALRVRAARSAAAPAAHERVADPEHDQREDRVVDVLEALAHALPFAAERFAGERQRRAPTGIEPISVSTVKRTNGMRATPAGSETNARTSGTMRPKSTTASP